LNEKIDWAKFSRILEKARYNDHKSNAGRKPYPLTLMFKIMILQSLYNLSDEQTEFQIKDRLSFMQFLGLNFENSIPDEKTIWLYKEMFTKAGIIRPLFNRFNRMLNGMGFQASKGSLIDASIVEVPIQRNTRKENEAIKNGEIPKEWEKQPEKLSQKDTDARWVTKHNSKKFGYKMHINADNKYKIIREVVVTSANVHDSQVFDELLGDNTSKDVWADSAYIGNRKKLPTGYREHIQRKGYKNHKLSDFQRELNHKRAKVRCRVEHVFGYVKGKMGLFIRSIGKVRAEARIMLASLTYNMVRYARMA
jgi:IS5 family transposase